MWPQKAPMKFIQNYLTQLQESLSEYNCILSSAQRHWLGFCLMGILLTNSICWAKFERMSFKTYTQATLSWMFRRAKLPWDKLLTASIGIILKKFKIIEGILVIDDKDLSRSKNAKNLYRLHKIKDKKTGGYILGQNIVSLYLVTKRVNIPVGFEFYAPDPDLKKWYQEIRRCKKNKIDKKSWPDKPERSPEYLKKYELAVKLVADFKKSFKEVKIQAVLADSLYCHLPFIEGVEGVYPDVQIITKMRKNQSIIHRDKKYSCEEYSRSYKGWEQDIEIRGGEKQTVTAGGGRFFVPSHQKNRFVIPMKYKGESEYRFLLATNLSWNMQSIMEVFSIRWLIEVFFEDWSCYNGFCSLAKQCGADGSLRPLILSLLFDHCFFFHEEQLFFLEKNRSLATFGTLLEKTKAQAICEVIHQILEDESPKKRLQEFVDILEDVFPLPPSKKHFSGSEVNFGSNEKIA